LVTSASILAHQRPDAFEGQLGLDLGRQPIVGPVDRLDQVALVPQPDPEGVLPGLALNGLGEAAPGDEQPLARCEGRHGALKRAEDGHIGRHLGGLDLDTERRAIEAKRTLGGQDVRAAVWARRGPVGDETFRSEDGLNQAGKIVAGKPAPHEADDLVVSGLDDVQPGGELGLVGPGGRRCRRFAIARVSFPIEHGRHSPLRVVTRDPADSHEGAEGVEQVLLKHGPRAVGSDPGHRAGVAFLAPNVPELVGTRGPPEGDLSGTGLERQHDGVARLKPFAECPELTPSVLRAVFPTRGVCPANGRNQFLDRPEGLQIAHVPKSDDREPLVERSLLVLAVAPGTDEPDLRERRTSR
jgi:hypothetical protein